MYHIKKGDTVKILSGKDRSKTGKVLAVDSHTGRTIVEGRNMLTRHEKAKRADKKGQKIQFAAPINISKLMLVCPNCGKAARAGNKVADKGKKLRVCKKCGKDIK